MVVPIVGQKYRLTEEPAEVYEIVKKQKKTMTIILRCVKSKNNSMVHQCIIRTVSNFMDMYEEMPVENDETSENDR